MSVADCPPPKSGAMECDECETTLVIDHDGDKRCPDCGLLSRVVRTKEKLSEWQRWFRHRRNDYSGWHGPERVKMVGGFVSAWDFVEDDYVN